MFIAAGVLYALAIACVEVSMLASHVSIFRDAICEGFRRATPKRLHVAHHGGEAIRIVSTLHAYGGLPWLTLGADTRRRRSHLYPLGLLELRSSPTSALGTT